MRIAVDATPLTGTAMTGVGRYVLTLLDALAARPEGKGTVVAVADAAAGARLPPGHPFDVHLLRVRDWLGPLAREASRQEGVRALCRAEGVDVLHATLDPVWPMAWTRQALTVHDVARGAKAARGLAVASPRERLRTAVRYRLARRADHVLTVSAFSRDQIARRLRIDRARITATPTAVPARFRAAPDPGETDRVLAARGLARGFILFVGEFGRQKNEAGLVAAWTHLRAEGTRVPLVLAGGGPLRVPDAEGLTVLRGFPDEELPHLYAGAACLCLPSFYEGFGLPVVEAMALARPVVVSMGTALAEVAGEAGIAVDPADPASIAGGLRTALDPARAAAWSARSAARAGYFTPERMIDGVLAAYREALRA